MVTEAGADLLFHAVFAAPLLEANRVRGVVVETKSGREALLARVVVDATGDADVAYRSGVPCESGRSSDGLNQPASLRFHLGNVDWERTTAFLRENGLPHRRFPSVSYAAGDGARDLAGYFQRCVAEDRVDAETIRYFQFFAVQGRPGEVSFNCPEIRGCVVPDSHSLSRVQAEGCRMIARLTDFCRANLPGFERAYVVAGAPMVGGRSSRRIRGEYLLTLGDVLNGARFPDAVARNNWPPDVRSPKQGEGLALEQTSFPGGYVEIPYCCLVPETIDNLLVAGRCISATFEAQAAIRTART